MIMCAFPRRRAARHVSIEVLTRPDVTMLLRAGRTACCGTTALQPATSRRGRRFLRATGLPNSQVADHEYLQGSLPRPGFNEQSCRPRADPQGIDLVGSNAIGVSCAITRLGHAGWHNRTICDLHAQRCLCMRPLDRGATDTEDADRRRIRFL